MYETMFSPVCLGGVELKNRIIFAPASMGLKDEEYKEKIRKIAAGGCAMIIIGDVPVARRFSANLYTAEKAFPFIRICAGLPMSRTAGSAPSFTSQTATSKGCSSTSPAC